MGWPRGGGRPTIPLTMSASPTSATALRAALRRVPMVSVALAMVGGIVAGRFGPLSAEAWGLWAVAAGLAAGGCLLRKAHLAAGACAAAAIFALGAVHVRVTGLRLPADHVVTYTGPARSLATLRGRIAGSPGVFRPPATTGYPRQPSTRFDLEADAIKTRDGWRGVRGLVQVSVAEEAPNLARGQAVEMVGWVSRIRPAGNPGERDPAALARRKGQFVSLRVPAADGVRVLARASGSWYRRLRDRAGAWARRHLARCAADEPALLLEALIVGRRDPGLQGLRDTMVRAGIAHLLSISGMHLGIFLGFVYLLCRLATLSPGHSAAAALVCLSGYLILAEPRSPLLRSAVMAAVLCAGVIVHRRHMALNALAAAAVLLLLADPLDVFAPGFQLSFLIVAGLIVLSAPLRDLLFGRWTRRRGLMVFRGEERGRRWLYFNAANWAMGAGTLSLLAWLLAAPLVAVHFGLLSPYGAPLTLLAVPLVVAVIVPGYVSLALAWAVPNLSHAIGRSAGEAAAALVWLVEHVGALPGLAFELRPVGPAWAAACYAALVVCVLQRSLRHGRAWACVAVGGVLALTAWTQRPAPPPSSAELNLLAVGAGQCAVLRVPDGTTYVLDAGSLFRSDCGEKTLVPFLRHQRLPAPAAAMISHANADHYNALGALLDRRWLRRVYLNATFGIDEKGPGAAAVNELMSRIRRDGIEVVRLEPGRRIPLDARTAVEVLWPPPNRADLSVNDTSLVLRITCDGRSVLVPGDLKEIGQAVLSARGESLRSDVLILPHHGAWEETLPAFVRAVSPETVLVSGAREPTPPVQAGNAARSFYERLAIDYKYYSTLRNGWIQVRFGRQGITVRTMHD